MFKSKKPKIEFISLVPGLDRSMPIEKTTYKDYQWMKKAYDDFKESKKEFNNPKTFKTHIVRCPGIFELMKKGWVQRAWMDIGISTNGDEYGFNWETPIHQPDFGKGGLLNYVGHHEDLVQRYTNDFRNLKSIIKIQSPWFAYVPKGYSLLVTPIPYPDHQDWEASFGILPSINGGPIQLSPQLKWYCKNEHKVIKAGTPLCQMFLLKDDEIESEIRSATERDKENVSLAFVTNHNRFVKSFSSLKRVIWSK